MMPRREKLELHVAVDYTLDSLRTWLDAELVADFLRNNHLTLRAYLSQLSHTHDGEYKYR